MNVRLESRSELTKALRKRYLGSSKREKSAILDTFCEATGYHRKYAITLLRGETKRRRLRSRAGRKQRYGPEVMRALVVAAEASGWICGKRLAPFLPELVEALEREGELHLFSGVRRDLIGMSAATIDRRLKSARQRARPRGITTTKPGSLLKRQIPVQTYTPWQDQRPGFVEIDLVAHCAESPAGEFVHTLTLTDLATGWTLVRAVPNRGQQAVFEALRYLRDRLPFPLLGIDSDNGVEFINNILLRYCRQEGITFTRCRAYHKNDQAHVEQKNWNIVRQWVGYDRYEGEGACATLNQAYDLLELYTNAYQPTRKCIGKTRHGARVTKRYDESATPYRRALALGCLDPGEAAQFEVDILSNGPLGLRRRIDHQLEQLWRLRVNQPVRRQGASA